MAAPGEDAVPLQREAEAIPLPAEIPSTEAAGAKSQALRSGKAAPPHRQPVPPGFTPNPGPNQPPLKDPMARVALSSVGADPDANWYWLEAINDPNLSAHERSDLIEDLNEDGLSDPEHPTFTDLPLIMNRLWLIDNIWQNAMDETNLEAFREAYKDLLDLAEVATGGGRPVR